jgi:hypothetical protein
MAFVALTTSTAGAVSPAAEALFEEGRRLMAAGNTAEACARFAESYALEASSGKLLNLALCHETEGKTATAWAEYRATARLARNEGREDRATTADQKVAALEPKLARLTTLAAKPVPGLKIASEDGWLGEGGLGLAVPIDPGVHRVTATAPGYRAWTASVEVQPNEQRALEIPPLAEEPKLAPAAPTLRGDPTSMNLRRRNDDAALHRSSHAPLIALGTLAAAGAIAGALFAVEFESSNGEAKTICMSNPQNCPETETIQYNGLRNDAIRDEIGEIVSFSVGSISLLMAGYFLWTSAPALPTTKLAGVQLRVLPLGGALGMGTNVEVTW